MLNLLPTASHLRAVIYFDTRLGSWVVRERSGAVTPELSSPIPESDAFVIFGERHCRGSDMKLRRDASAMLSLGPKMQKDAFMQAAGRLRKLGRSQTITIVALPDVHNSICEFAAASESSLPRCVHKHPTSRTPLLVRLVPPCLTISTGLRKKFVVALGPMECSMCCSG